MECCSRISYCSDDGRKISSSWNAVYKYPTVVIDDGRKDKLFLECCFHEGMSGYEPHLRVNHEQRPVFHECRRIITCERTQTPYVSVGFTFERRFIHKKNRGAHKTTTTVNNNGFWEYIYVSSRFCPKRPIARRLFALSPAGLSRQSALKLVGGGRVILSFYIPGTR